MSLTSHSYKRLCKLYRGVLNRMRVLEWMMERGLRTLDRPAAPALATLEPCEPRLMMSGFVPNLSGTELDGVTQPEANNADLVGWLLYNDDNSNGRPDAGEAFGVATKDWVFTLSGEVPSDYAVRKVFAQGSLSAIAQQSFESLLEADSFSQPAGQYQMSLLGEFPTVGEPERDMVHPNVLNSLSFTFSQDDLAVSAGDLTLYDRENGQLINTAAASFTKVGTTATWSWATPLTSRRIYVASFPDSITDSQGIHLDGDADGVEGGRYRREIVVAGFGDASVDGAVDDDDLSLLLSNWGLNVGWTQGNFNGDSTIDSDDLSYLLSNWGLYDVLANSAPAVTSLSIQDHDSQGGLRAGYSADLTVGYTDAVGTDPLRVITVVWGDGSATYSRPVANSPAVVDHIYADAGAYNGWILLDDGVNPSAKTPFVAYVDESPVNTPPVIVAVLAPQTVAGTSATITVDAYDEYGGPQNLTYHWTLPAGLVGHGPSYTTTSPSLNVTFTSHGTYEFQVYVEDAAGLTSGDPVQVLLSVVQTPADLVFRPYSDMMHVGQMQQFQLRYPDQFGNPLLGVQWFAELGQVDATGLFTAPTTLWDTPPLAELYVTAQFGSDHCDAELWVYSLVPSISGAALLDESESQQFMFSTFNWQGMFGDLSWSVDWGDGIVDQAGPGSSIQLSHQYADSGNYTIIATVTDENGSETVSLPVVVENLAPLQPNVGGPSTAVTGRNLECYGSASDPSPVDSESLQYSWRVLKDGTSFELPVGTITSEQLFVFAPVAAGYYAIMLTVTDKDGATSEEGGLSIDVAEPPSVTNMSLNDGQSHRLQIDRISFTFDQPVFVNPSGLIVVRASDGQVVDLTNAAFSYADDKATWNLSTVALGDGNYIATLPASAVGTVYGDMATDVECRFYKLLGDMDGDRQVDQHDLAAILEDAAAAQPHLSDLDHDGDFDTSDVAVFQSLIGNTAPALIAQDSSATCLTDGFVDVAVSGEAFDGEITSYVLFREPDNGRIESNPGGTFRYTPNAGFVGQDSFLFTAIASSGESSSPARVTISVSAVNQAPTASSAEFSADEDAALFAQLPSSDPDGDALTAEVTQHPVNGIVVILPDGTFRYTPNAHCFGSDSFTYRPWDGAVYGNEATVTITVNPVNDAPSAIDDEYQADQDSVFTGNVIGNDIDQEGHALNVMLVSQPARAATFFLNGDGSFSYAPAAGFVGTDMFTYRVIDQLGAQSHLATVALTTNKVNQAPVVEDLTLAMDEDTVLRGRLIATDANGDAVTFVEVEDANGWVAIDEDGYFTITPGADENGVYEFSYKVNDGTADSILATATCTIVAVNDVPRAVDRELDGNEGQDITGSLLLLVQDAEGDNLTVCAVHAPRNGDLMLEPDGEFVFTPDAGWWGQDSFTYTVSDGTGESSLYRVVLNVVPLPSEPVVVADEFSRPLAPSGHSWFLDVLANDSDHDGDSVSIVSHTEPEHGDVDLADGRLNYTPDEGFVGQDGFTYWITDGTTVTNEVAVVLRVRADNLSPVAPSATFARKYHDERVVDLEAWLQVYSSDADGDALAIVLSGTPVGGTLTRRTDGLYEYALTNDLNGNGVAIITFTYVASDGVLSTAGTAKIEVALEPRLLEQQYAMTHGMELIIPWEGLVAGGVVGDTSSTPLFEFSQSGVFQNLADGTFRYCGTTLSEDPQVVSVRVGGAAGTDWANVWSDWAQITVTVSNSKPVAADDSYAVRSGQSFTIGAEDGVLANDIDSDGTVLNISEYASFDEAGQGPAVHGSLALADDGSLTYEPPAGFVGEDRFIYRCTDGRENAEQRMIVFHVMDLAPVGGQDELWTQTNTSLTFAPDDLLRNDWAKEGSLTIVGFVGDPSDIAVDANGNFVFTAPPNWEGVRLFSYRLTDGVEEVEVGLAIHVVNAAPLAIDDYLEIEHNNVLVFDAQEVLLENDIDDDVATTLTHDLPATLDTAHGLLARLADGRFSYQPDEGFVGVDTFSYRVSDGIAQSREASVYINVLGTAPGAGDWAGELQAGHDLTIPWLQLVAEAPNNAATFELIGEPSYGQLGSCDRDNGIAYLANEGRGGLEVIQYLVRDSAGLESFGRITILVTPVARQMDVEDATFPVSAGLSIGGSLCGFVTDPESRELAFAQSDARTHKGVLTLWENGSFSYRPDINETGEDVFDISICDGLATMTLTFQIGNAAPVAKDDAYFGFRGQVLNVGPTSGVLANDVDEHVLQLSASTTDSNVQMRPDGSFIFICPEPYSNSSYTFSYLVTDAQGSSASGSATIELADPMTQLVPNPDHYVAYQGKSLHMPSEFGVLRNDFVASGLTVTAEWADPEVEGRGQLIVNADGSFDYTPPQFTLPSGQPSSVTFAYRAISGSIIVESTFTIEIRNHTAVAGDDVDSVMYDGMISRQKPTSGPDKPFGVLANDFDHDGDNVKAMLVGYFDVSAGAWVSRFGDSDLAAQGQPERLYREIVCADGSRMRLCEDGSYEFGHSGGTESVYTFFYRAFDGSAGNTGQNAGDSRDSWGQITIRVVDNAPVGISRVFTVHSGQQIDGDALAGAYDPDDHGFWIKPGSVTSPEPNTCASFDLAQSGGNAGQFSFTAAANYSGPATFSFILTDGFKDSDRITITLDVVNSVPSGNPDTLRLHHAEESGHVNVFDNDAVITGKDWEGDSVTPVLVTFDGVVIEGGVQQTYLGQARLSADGKLTFEPNDAPGHAAVRPVRVYYAIRDGAGCSSPIPVDIEVVDLAPQAVDDFAQTSGVAPVGGSVAANDFDMDSGETLTWTPANGSGLFGSLQLQPDGSFTYTPNATMVRDYCRNRDVGTILTDKFEYEVSDGVLTSKAALTVMLTDELVIAKDDIYQAGSGGLLDVTASGAAPKGIFANDFKSAASIVALADGHAFGVEFATGNGGKFTVASSGAFTYQAPSGFVGEDTFTYTLSNISGSSLSKGTVTVVVVGGDVVALDDVYAVPVEHAGPITVDSTVLYANDDITAEGPRTVQCVDWEAEKQTSKGGQVSLSQDQQGHWYFTYTRPTTWADVDQFKYKVTVGGQSSTAIVTLSLTGAAPVAQNDTRTANQGVLFSVSVADLLQNDTKGCLGLDSGTFRILTQPWFADPNATDYRKATVEGGVVYYQLPADIHGEKAEAFTYLVKDSSGRETIGTVYINVTPPAPPPLPPVAVPDIMYVMGARAQVSPLANDTQGAELVSISGSADFGYYSVDDNGVLTYTLTIDRPDANWPQYCLVDTLSYVISHEGVETTGYINIVIPRTGYDPTAPNIDEEVQGPHYYVHYGAFSVVSNENGIGVKAGADGVMLSSAEEGDGVPIGCSVWFHDTSVVAPVVRWVGNGFKYSSFYLGTNGSLVVDPIQAVDAYGRQGNVTLSAGSYCNQQGQLCHGSIVGPDGNSGVITAQGEVKLHTTGGDIYADVTAEGRIYIEAQTPLSVSPEMSIDGTYVSPTGINVNAGTLYGSQKHIPLNVADTASFEAPAVEIACVGDFAGEIDAGSIPSFVAHGDVSGTITATGNIASLIAYGDITVEITADTIGAISTLASRRVNTALKPAKGDDPELDAAGRVLSSLRRGYVAQEASGGDINATITARSICSVTAVGNIGFVTAAGNVVGAITANDGGIGSIWALATLWPTSPARAYPPFPSRWPSMHGAHLQARSLPTPGTASPKRDRPSREFGRSRFRASRASAAASAPTGRSACRPGALTASL